MTAVVWPHRVSPFAQNKDAKEVEAKPAVAGRTVRMVMAGGGTGGHLYPGLAVAEALEAVMRERGGAVELLWAATPRTVDQRLLGKFGTRYVQQPVQPLVRQVSKLWGFWRGWRESCGYWRRVFTEQKVDGVLALGGYAAGPAAYVAGKVGVPVGLINPDALPGLANRFLLKRAEKVFVQWELPGELTKGIRGQVLAAGCPIRQSLFGRSRAEGAQRLGLDAGKKTLVITGGSLAAKNINDALMELLKDEAFGAALLAGGWQVLHLTGTEQAGSVKAAYEPIKSVAHLVLDYCDDMASVYALADLVVARAGASTCAELTACGVPAVLVPYPYHRDLHQRANALKLVAAGAAVLVEDRKESGPNATAIKAPLLKLLCDDAAREHMAGRARRAGKPAAAKTIAEAMLALAGT